ncbi:MAG: type I-E CRISPR-associated protein Cse2/CasB [Chloroflexi bacterium]|nr:type I-E CRISPR-associated protein Cse2/CasB [Chloroflexota bacterium]
MTPTDEYIGALTRLKRGDLGLLRTHSGQGLNQSVDGFDLFAGIWWPLRSKNQRAPRREVAWLVAKLYACCPILHLRGMTLAGQLRQCRPSRDPEGRRFQERFDRMLMLPLDRIEPQLRWALAQVAADGRRLDWVRLTDDLSRWERESVRLKWAEEFLGTDERR